MKYILGIDLGTSGTKTVLFDEHGKNVASSTVLYDLIQPQNGWAEQDPHDWWNAAVTTINEVIKKSNVSVKDIKGVGISGQMHGLVMVDEKGEVLHNAILWCDGRTTKECAYITEKVGKERLMEITANPALTGFTAGKILWIRNNKPDVYKKCHKILLPKDYVRYKLTGLFGAEVSDASGTNLFDIKARTWSDEILDTLEIDKKFFPPCNESVDVAGNVSEEAAKATGLSTDTIVCYGGADNASAGIGTGVVKKGLAFTTIGSSGVIFAHSDEVQIDIKGRVHTFCSAVPNSYTVMSCTLSAGMALKWFRDNFCSSEVEVASLINCDSYEFINAGIKDIPIGALNLIFLPYLLGERSPILDEKARGVLFGLSTIHSKYHVARAIMEGVMYSQKHCLDVINGMGINPEKMYACGGGAKSLVWREMMSDVYNTPVIINESEEGPALGVAILASVACGIYKDIETACDKLIKPKEVQQPNVDKNKQYLKFYELYKELYPNFSDSFKKLSEM